MIVKVLLTLVPCLAAAKMVPVPDSDASGTTNFESFGSFGGFQGMSQLHEFAHFSDQEGQFDSSSFDRAFGDNRRHDIDLDNFGSLREAPRKYDTDASRRVNNPLANVYSIAHHGMATRGLHRPVAAVPTQSYAVARPHILSANPAPRYSAQSLLSAGQTPAYKVRPVAGVEWFTAARQAIPVPQNRLNPQRLPVVNANPPTRVAPLRGYGLYPQESSNSVNKYQEDFQKHLGSEFGSNENLGFDFGAEGF